MGRQIVSKLNRQMYSFPWAAITNYYKLGGLKQYNLIRESEIKVSPGLVPSEGSEGQCVSYVSPSFWWLSAVLTVLWLPET